MASYKTIAKTASMEIARKTDELNAAKAQVARLKMELGLSLKGKEEVEAKLSELTAENALLRGQVAQSQMAMKSTLEEAIKLLAEGELLASCARRGLGHAVHARRSARVARLVRRHCPS